MPLRTKLLASFLLVVAATGCVIAVVGVRFVYSSVARRAQSEVGHGLEVALQLYGSRLEEIRTAIAFTAIRPITVRRALEQRDEKTLADELSKVRAECGLDLLSITDAAGCVVLRCGNPRAAGDDMSGDALVGGVLTGKEPLTATQVWTGQQLEKEAPGLAAATREGLLMMAAAPVFTQAGGLAGVLYGGSLLNRERDRRKRPIVDRIRDAVFNGGEGAGIVAILQANAVVCTSPAGAQGDRMLGPPERGDVERAVLTEARRWQGRCFAAGEWHIAACEPLRDLRGDPVAMIYVGVPEKKYAAVQQKTVLIFSGVTLAGMIVAAGISFALAAGILRPLAQLSTAASELGSGNLDCRVAIDSRGPLGKLADTFNRMADSIKERDERIQNDAREMAEARRLATLGQLAAGVAHEINNPLGGITVYAHLLLEELPPGHPESENARKIVNEADRCKKIVKGLLDYARQSQVRKESVDINTILGAAATLVTQQKVFERVVLRKHLPSDLPAVDVDASQMEEVFINILLNAAEAMQGEGEIDIEGSVSAGGERVAVKISDTGPGVPPENIHRIFDPFFTSKETGHGTGLGLAISYGIVENHGGSIRVENNAAGGATFIVELPSGDENST